MPISRLSRLLPLLTIIGLSLGSCQKDTENTPKTEQTSTQKLTVGNWRLDQIRQDGAVLSSGAAIKDQYALTFRPDGTYTQRLLADNTRYNGTWMLMSNNSMLHLTDHKGTENAYTVVSLTSTELRYSFTNKTNQTEERVFSAQP